MVTNKYSEMLHLLEAEGLLELSVVEELFSVHYTLHEPGNLYILQSLIFLDPDLKKNIYIYI